MSRNRIDYVGGASREQGKKRAKRRENVDISRTETEKRREKDVEVDFSPGGTKKAEQSKVNGERKA